jgi:hypothetical protein
LRQKLKKLYREFSFWRLFQTTCGRVGPKDQPVPVLIGFRIHTKKF